MNENLHCKAAKNSKYCTSFSGGTRYTESFGCKDCLSITFILLLPCQVQQVLACIRCFKRELLATLFHPEDWHREVSREGQNSEVFRSYRPAWQFQQALEEMGCGYVPVVLVCCSSRQNGWASLQAAPGSASL